MWSNASSIRTATAPLKKLMDVLESAGIVSSKENRDMKSYINDNQPYWIEDMDYFNTGFWSW